jgi:hypothetical protein
VLVLLSAAAGAGIVTANFCHGLGADVESGLAAAWPRLPARTAYARDTLAHDAARYRTAPGNPPLSRLTAQAASRQHRSI